MNVEALTFEECLHAFDAVVRAHQTVSDPEVFLETVRTREALVSTATPDQVAFPHARTHAVSQLFLAIGRSKAGISFRADLPVVHLVFLIGTPPDAISEYLGCVAWLARRMRSAETRRSLLTAETPVAFLKTIATSSA